MTSLRTRIALSIFRVAQLRACVVWTENFPPLNCQGRWNFYTSLFHWVHSAWKSLRYIASGAVFARSICWMNYPGQFGSFNIQTNLSPWDYWFSWFLRSLTWISTSICRSSDANFVLRSRLVGAIVLSYMKFISFLRLFVELCLCSVVFFLFKFYLIRMTIRNHINIFVSLGVWLLISKANGMTLNHRASEVGTT